jgi:hypothetical protein
MSKILRIECPDCHATLEVDAETGVILEHHRPSRTVELDLDSVGEQLRRQAQQRDERFRQSVLAEKQKEERLHRKFEEALKKARENPDVPPPPRDLDLD